MTIDKRIEWADFMDWLQDMTEQIGPEETAEFLIKAATEITVVTEATNKRNKATCNFCGLAANDVIRLVMGPSGAHICNGCIEVCNEIISEKMDI